MKTILYATAVLLFAGAIEAAYLTDVPKTLVQPDGDTIQCFASGDEFYHWIHDAEGYTITRDSKTGYWVYAQKSGDKLVASSLIVGKDTPDKSLLAPWLKISDEAYRARRDIFYADKSAADAPDSGLIENLVVFVRFKGEAEFVTDREHFEEVFNSGKDPVWNTDLSLNNYFKTVSYGKLNIESDFYPACEPNTNLSYEDSFSRDYYRPDSVASGGYKNEDEKKQREQTLVKNALEFIKDEISEFWFADTDNDGNVDNVTVIVKGSPDEWDDLLWPHQWELTVHTVMLPTMSKDKKVNDYIFTFESDHLGVFCHETFHSIGAPDLYRYDNKSVKPVGPWDVMANNQNPPQHMGAYMKRQYGHPWLNYGEITVSGDYTLKPLADTSGVRAYRIQEPGSYLDIEYYTIEYRKKDQKTYERNLPGSGLIVNRINSLIFGSGNGNGPPDEVYIFRPGGTVTDSGLINQAHFSKDVDRVAITRRTDPAPFLNDGSVGNLFIADIGPAQAGISFYVGITPLELSGLVYNGIGGPFVVAGNPYWLVGDITVPNGQGLAVSNGTHIYFEPNRKMTSEGTLFVESGAAWTRMHNTARYRTGLRTKGNIRMLNGGAIKLK